MTKYIIHAIMVGFIFLNLLIPFQGTAQGSKLKIPIRFESNNGRVYNYAIGWHPDAQRCNFDPYVPNDFSLEFSPCDIVNLFEYPPAGTGFDLFLRDIKNCGANGWFNDIHPPILSTQKDTFGFQINWEQSGDAPVTITWPSTLSLYCDSMRIQYADNSDPDNVLIFRINMLTQSSHQINSLGVSQARIIVTGPKGAQTAPIAPTLDLPSNESVVNPSPFVQVSWGTAPGAVLYHINVSTDSLGSSIVFSDTVPGNSVNVDGLLEGKRYYWFVRSISEYLAGCFQTTPRSFITALSPPILSAPSDGQINVDVNPILRWKKLASATSYQVQLSTNSTFTNIIKDTLVTDSLVQFLSLENCRTYFWRVKTNTAVISSAFSSGKSFTIVPATPEIPTLALPLDNATVSVERPMLSWESTDLCSDSFLVELSLTSNFSSLLISQKVKSSPFQPQPLEGQETYFWRVKGVNTLGVLGSASIVRQFTTGTFIPRVPMLVGPPNNDIIPSSTVMFAWQTPPNKPTMYFLEIDTTAGFNSPLHRDSITSTDTLEEVSGLNYCTRYFWRVKAGNAAGASPNSPAFSFMTDRHIPGPPVLLYPAEGDTGITDSLPFRWQGDKCSQSYVIQVSLDSGFVSIIQQDSGAILSTFITLDEPSTIHYWHVLAYNELGAGEEFARGSFKTASATTPKVPNLLSPADRATGILKNPVLCWDSTRGPDTWRLQVAIDSNFNSLVFNDSTLTSTCKQVGPLLFSKTYYWRVNAKNAVGTSDYSSVRRFTTLFPPDKPTLIAPPDGATGVSLQPGVQWSIPERADKYQLQVAKDEEFYVVVYNDSNIVPQSWQLFNLDERTTYYWRVRARNVSGVSPWSDVFNFKTTIVGPANWVVPISVKETGFGQDTLYFGLHPNASHGIDAQLGEFELPPPMIGQFESRFVDIPTRPGRLREGVRLNLLPFHTYSQVDSFRFSFQLGTGEYPVHISWNSNFVRTICDSMIIMDMFGGLALKERMDLVSSAAVTNVSTNSLLIVSYGAFPVPTDVKDRDIPLPEGFTLSQNYPNPFNPETRIEFSNDQPAFIVVGVYDVLGREISRLVNTDMNPGVHHVYWNGQNEQGVSVPSGMYHLRMIVTPHDAQSDPAVFSRKMVLIK